MKKQSDPVQAAVPAPVDPLFTDAGAGSHDRNLQNQFISALVKRVGQTGLSAAALGISLPTIGALANGSLWGRPETELPTQLLRPRPLTYPTVHYGDPLKRKPREHKELLQAALSKESQSQADSPVLPGLIPYMKSLPNQPGVPDPSTGSWWFGRDAEPGKAIQVPAYGLGITAVGLGSLYGGLRVGKSLVEGLRRSRMQSDVNSARDRFRQAIEDSEAAPAPLGEPFADVAWRGRPRRVRLMPQGTTGELDPSVYGQIADPTKKASSPTLGQELERLAGLVIEKSAQAAAIPAGASPAAPPPVVTPEAPKAPYSSAAANVYMTGAGLLALVSGLATYKHFRAQDPSRLLAQAVKQRARARWLDRPPEVYLAPVPGRNRPGLRFDDTDEQSV